MPQKLKSSGSAQRVYQTVTIKAVAIANETLQPVDSVRNLGVYLDSEFNMRAHITKTTQACFFQLRRLRQIR